VEKDLAQYIEIIDTVNGYFEKKDKSHYIEGMKSLNITWTKCIELKRLY